VIKNQTKMKNNYVFRQQRSFSTELKKEIVGQIERGEYTVSQIVREYQLGGRQTVYQWLYLYSRTLKKGYRLVMEKESQDKTTQELKKRIQELEAALGRKSLEADLYRVIVEKASAELKTDLKKSFGDGESKSSQK
jgi:transposase-like protein